MKQRRLYTLIGAGIMTVAFAPNVHAQTGGSRPGQTFTEGQATERASPKPDSRTAPAEPRQAPAKAASSDEKVIPAGTPVIMEFSDLQCPDSARYNSGLKNTILQRYVRSGKAAYQWHDFPLSEHANAPEAAAVARCMGSAAPQMRQKIFANQSQMSMNMYEQYARQLGVDPAQLTSCVKSGNSMREVMNDEALGKSIGVHGTPTLVLGTADGKGHVKPLKVVKAYDPPQQVLAQINTFIAGTSKAAAQRPAAGR